MFSRVEGVILLGAIAWVLGLGSVFSFNIWSTKRFFGFDFLSLMDFITNNLMLPIGGLAISIFVGWVLSQKTIQEEIKVPTPLFKIFIFCLRVIAPMSISVIFLSYFFS